MRPHQSLGIGEIVVHEVEDEVAGAPLKMRVHGNLAEKVFDVRAGNDEGTEAVPKVVERKQSFAAAGLRLVVGLHKRPAELDGERQIIALKLLAKRKQVGGGEIHMAVGIGVGMTALDEAVASHELLLGGIPYNKLVVAIFRRIIAVYVDRCARATTCCTESELAQAANFLHNIRTVVVIDQVQQVVAFVGAAQKALRAELLQQQFAGDGGNDGFHERKISRCALIKHRRSKKERSPSARFTDRSLRSLTDRSTTSP